MNFTEKKIGNETMAAESSPQFMPEPRQSAPEPVTRPEPVQPVKTFPADTRTAGIQHGQSIAQSDSVADVSKFYSQSLPIRGQLFEINDDVS